jgi:hypothetical protein
MDQLNKKIFRMYHYKDSIQKSADSHDCRMQGYKPQHGTLRKMITSGFVSADQSALIILY